MFFLVNHISIRMSDARAYAQRNQRGSDWFSHDDKAAVVPSSVQATVSPKKEAPAEPEAGRAQLIKPKDESNQWFKHDGADQVPAARASPAKSQPVVAAGKTEETAGAASNREGNAYSRRDKMGTSASWFHGDGEKTEATARVVSKEGGDNASRMRGESENWFSHDSSNNGANKELHVSKGRTNRPQNDEMRQIFNMGK
jgi:hypothetical protein